MDRDGSATECTRIHWIVCSRKMSRIVGLRHEVDHGEYDDADDIEDVDDDHDDDEAVGGDDDDDDNDDDDDGEAQDDDE